jgi:hypothetical protein
MSSSHLRCLAICPLTSIFTTVGPNLTYAWKQFHAIKAESKERRQKYLDACLADAVDKVNRANTLWKIISAKAAAKLYQRL